MQSAINIQIFNCLISSIIFNMPLPASAELNIQHTLNNSVTKLTDAKSNSHSTFILTNATSHKDTTNINASQPKQDIFEIINLAQGRSFDLLMNHYQDCYHINTEYDLNQALNANFKVTIYEKHNSQCGGNSNTSPRVATYFIDAYGRIFKHNVANSTHDLQYKFNETPVVVTDLSNFEHPTRTVFDKYGIKLRYLEKRADDTFVIFYVDNTPWLPITHEDAQHLANVHMWLFKQLLEANGSWDFMIRTEEGAEYFIKGGRRKLIDKDSYRIY